MNALLVPGQTGDATLPSAPASPQPRALAGSARRTQLADRDPEDARALLDTVLERMLEAVHRYEGTVNQIMGDGIMALFDAPLTHEDHAVRACYAALRMHRAMARGAEDVRRRLGVDVQIRVGINSGEVVVRSIDNDLQMDYSAVGQTTHLAARMEQLAHPGTTLITGATYRLVERLVDAVPQGPMPIKGLRDPVEVFELRRATPVTSSLGAVAGRARHAMVRTWMRCTCAARRTSTASSEARAPATCRSSDRRSSSSRST